VSESAATPSAALKKLMRTPVAFGLRAQGHFDTVMQMRKDGRSWEEIGREIGWTPEAVERFFETEKR
jgi:hypothetical protein